MLRLLTGAKSSTAAPLVPSKPTLDSLRGAAARCHACPLWKHATQTVFGEGLASARLVLVGEEPGNDEDLSGRPFVGPAGRLLDEALAEAGLSRADVYVTNVVKHFKWSAEGDRRVHQKPTGREVGACMPWLEAELLVLKPEVVLCLGSTAAQALLGKDFRVTQHRGQFVSSHPFAPLVGATVHPSSILRTAGDAPRAEARASFVADLRLVAQALSLRA